MKKTIRLTESELIRIVNRVIKEQTQTNSQNIPQACKTKFSQEIFNNAVNWWKTQLINPNFWVKIGYNHFGVKDITKLNKKDFNDYLKQVEQKVKNAVQRLSELKIKYVNEPGSGAIAEVIRIDPKSVYVNCASTDTQSSPDSVFIHELQHAIDGFLGIESEEVLRMAAMTGGKFFHHQPVIDYDVKVDNEKLNFPIKQKPSFSFKSKYGDFKEPDEYFQKNLIRKYLKGGGNMRYNCEKTEVASRIAQVRHALNLSPSEDITLDMLKIPEIYQLFFRNLLCWAAREDNMSLQVFLNELNKIAKNDTKNNTSDIA
jgi:hypothetical protein